MTLRPNSSFFLVATGIFLGLTGCNKDANQGPTGPAAPRAVKIVEADIAPGRNYVFTGTIEPFQDIEASFEVGGRIIEMAVDEGQNVAKGDVLARLDDRDYKSKLDSAQATFDRALADKNRQEKLLATKTVSQAQFDRTLNVFQNAQAALEIAQKELEETVLRSQVDGRVAKKTISDLRNVQPGQTVYRVHDLSKLKVQVDMPETLIAYAPVIDLDKIRENLVATARITALPHIELEAKAYEISTVADEGTRTFRATLLLTTQENMNVLPGMTVVVDGRRKDEPLVTVPTTAIRGNEAGETFVWKLDPSTMKVSQQAVTATDAIGDHSIIASGLQRGDEIANSGFNALRPDMEVKRFTLPGER